MDLVKKLFLQYILGFKIKHDPLNEFGVTLVLIEKSHCLDHLPMGLLDYFLTVVGWQQLYEIL